MSDGSRAELAVLHWNTNIEENIEKIGDELARPEFGADVICLQELSEGLINDKSEVASSAQQKEAWLYIAERFKLFHRVQTIPNIKENGDIWTQANAIFSKYPIVDSYQQWIYEPKESDNPQDQYRGYMDITIDVNGRLVTIASSHMDWRQDPHRDQELEKLLSIIERHKEHYIFSGDLNVIPTNSRITEIGKILLNSGPAYDISTWPTKPSPHEMEVLSRRYDYMFHTSDLVVLGSVALDSFASDHRAIKNNYLLPA